MRGRVFCWALSVVALSMSSNIGNACASFARSGDEVALASENVLIVWNPEKKTEHFIRSAGFKGKGSDFAFIVPTPSVPELGEASQWLYNHLFSVIPKPKENHSLSLGSAGGGFGRDEGVEEIKREQVAGYDVSVLKASDPNSLMNWLKRNDYVMPEGTQNWVAPYVKQGWAISALKILRTPGSQDVATKPVRMTFDTKTATYPYREPVNSKPAQSRHMDLYVVAPYPVRGVYTNSNQLWGGVRKAVVQHADLRKILIDQAGIPADLLPDKLVLSYFRDFTIVRPDFDLTFVQDLMPKRDSTPRKRSR